MNKQANPVTLRFKWNEAEKQYECLGVYIQWPRNGTANYLVGYEGCANVTHYGNYEAAQRAAIDIITSRLGASN